MSRRVGCGAVPATAVIVRGEGVRSGGLLQQMLNRAWHQSQVACDRGRILAALGAAQNDPA
jgi:hypothetical protein